MLNSIFEFLEILFSPILTLIDVVIGFIRDIVYLITLLSTFVLELPALFEFLPNTCVILLLSVFGLVVLYKIIGREG